MTSDDLLYYYKTVIHPVTEYACAVWHSSITAKQRDQLEAIRRRAVQIIFGKELDFDILAIIHDIPLLADRRDRQMRQLFAGMHDSSHCLHRLLLENCRVSHSHVAQPQELLGTIRKNKHLKTHFYYMPYETFNECCWLSVIYTAYWHFIECIGLLVCHCHFIQPQGCKINKNLVEIKLFAMFGAFIHELCDANLHNLEWPHPTHVTYYGEWWRFGDIGLTKLTQYHHLLFLKFRFLTFRVGLHIYTMS